MGFISAFKGLKIVPSTMQFTNGNYWGNIRVLEGVGFCDLSMHLP